MIDIAGNSFLQNYTHNLKVVGSNPTPATKAGKQLRRLARGGFLRFVAKNSQPSLFGRKEPEGHFVLPTATNFLSVNTLKISRFH